MTKNRLLQVTAVVVAMLLIFTFAGCDPLAQLLPTEKTTVAISHAEITLGVWESFELTAVSSDGTPVQWNSASTAVATVSSDGVVVGISAGETEIVAVAGSGHAICKVTVVEDLIEGDIFLPLTSARLQIGYSLTLKVITPTADSVVWDTSSSAVATVQDGVVTGIAQGVALITASVGSTVQECVVTVSDQPTSTLELSKQTASVKQGEYLTLTALTSEPVTWLSDDTSIATVDNGVIKGVTQGTVAIYAWTSNSSVACLVTVRDPADPYKEGYVLVWNDEFTGDSLDLTKWDYMLGVQDFYGNSRGPMYWGNNELQYYTKDAATVRDGMLVITAQRADTPDDRTFFTSARLHTRDKGYWTYGYFEARMQTPAQVGMWPAFWMLPQPSSPTSSNNKYGGWAANGEIDIMEARGSAKSWVDTTLHYADGNSNRRYNTYKGTTTKIDGTTEDWHTYALEWCADHMSWFIDGLEVLRIEHTTWNHVFASTNQYAPFDVDFYILLNLAVGGNYDQGRAPSDDFVSAEMRVDYVRVYQTV